MFVALNGSGGLADLRSEVGSLETLRRAGVRVPAVHGEVRTINGMVGVVMEKLVGTEIKETRFNMKTEKQTIKRIAEEFGVEKVIDQLEALDAFIQKNGGISNLQCFMSSTKGFIVFAPAALGTSRKNGGPRALID